MHKILGIYSYSQLTIDNCQMILLVLDGDSWVDKGSCLALIELLRQVTFEDVAQPVEVIDVDDRNSHDQLKKGLKKAKVLVISDGNPVHLSKALKKNGLALITQQMRVSEMKVLCIGGGIAFATSFLHLPGVELINYETWQQSGLSGSVTIHFNVCSDYLAGRMPDFTELEYHYNSGPLLRPTYGLAPFDLVGAYASDIVATHSQRLDELQREYEIKDDGYDGRWICKKCTQLNDGCYLLVLKCNYCQVNQTSYHLPPIGEMSNCFAMVMGPKYLFFSVHPELSNKSHFIQLVELFLARN